MSQQTLFTTSTAKSGEEITNFHKYPEAKKDNVVKKINYRGRQIWSPVSGSEDEPLLAKPVLRD